MPRTRTPSEPHEFFVGPLRVRLAVTDSGRSSIRMSAAGENHGFYLMSDDQLLAMEVACRAARSLRLELAAGAVREQPGPLGGYSGTGSGTLAAGAPVSLVRAPALTDLTDPA